MSVCAVVLQQLWIRMGPGPPHCLPLVRRRELGPNSLHVVRTADGKMGSACVSGYSVCPWVPGRLRLELRLGDSAL